MGIVGLVALVAAAWLLSENRKAAPWKTAAWGLGLQIVFAILVLGIPALGVSGPLRGAFKAANDLVVALLRFTDEGSRFIFGSLLDSEKFGYIFAFQVLPTIIFVASIMAVFYHLGVMQKIVKVIAILMQKSLGTSGAESLAMAANIFVGQTEAPLVIKPYLERMTRSEMFSVMVGGMASVAGGVLAAYVGLLKDRIPDIAGHLLTASFMSAPAAFVAAKLMIPETEKAETMGRTPEDLSGVHDANVIEAAARGASEGLTLALNVAAMLLAFIALIAASDAVLGWFGNAIGFAHWGTGMVPNLLLKEGQAQLSLALVFGWIFAPLAFLMGVPWAEAATAGALLGEKVVLNEFVAYMHLAQWSEHLSPRSMVILSYALCGFANFSSIAIQIGGIGALVPTRRSDLARLGIRSVIAGSIASFMTAAIAGLLI